MATKPNKTPQASDESPAPQGINFGDVTEPKALPPMTAVGEIQPLADLPAGYECLAERHPAAIGFTLEGGSVALHF